MDFVLNRPEGQGRQILIAGPNIGCGSSREHAVWALADYGFRVVVSSGFADIFRSNALRLGLLPVEADQDWVERLAAACSADPGLEIEVDLESGSLACGELETSFEIDQFSRHCMLQGIDAFDYLLSQREATEQFRSPGRKFIDTSGLQQGGGQS